jgi:hypothetical protein
MVVTFGILFDFILMGLLYLNIFSWGWVYTELISNQPTNHMDIMFRFLIASGIIAFILGYYRDQSVE